MKQLRTDLEFTNQIQNGKVNVVLFVLPTHQACIELFDRFIELEKSANPEQVEFSFVSVDDSANLVMRFSIRQAPFVMLFNNEGRIKVSSGDQDDINKVIQLLTV